MIDRATLETRRAELMKEMEHAREVSLRLQGALILMDELLAILTATVADD
jgi:hypothetical protein